MASVRKNFAVLMSLQISTYIVPLLTLPWLTRTLSPGGYGHLSFALAFTTYFVTFSNYGFYLTATPQIAIHRHDRMQRSKIFFCSANEGSSGRPAASCTTSGRYGASRLSSAEDSSTGSKLMASIA